jgi:hypothetical protein
LRREAIETKERATGISWKTAPGSTGRLLQLCAGYFGFYVMTGVLAKYFTGLPGSPLYHKDITYLANNTLGSSLFALGVVFLLRWVRLHSNRPVQWGRLRFPSELFYIVPSGICTAIVIPTTTLMYTLPISVMVAMVIMRGSVIVISRLVDAAQIAQGILKKRVYAEENWAVVFALLAVGVNVLWVPSVINGAVDVLEALGVRSAAAWHQTIAPGKGGFEFFQSGAAMTIMGLYIVAYTVRIYIMNFYKNTRAKGVPQDNRGFFAFEQISASLTMLAAGVFFFLTPVHLGWTDTRVLEFRTAMQHLDPAALVSGIPYGAVAFFSVFIFMFQGRTATFAGLVNRLTSLIAGTTATVLTALLLGASMPSLHDWVGLAFIFVAVYFLTRAEKLRVAEGVGQAGESPAAPAPGRA